jgi:hypothetical protein
MINILIKAHYIIIFLNITVATTGTFMYTPRTLYDKILV